MSFLFLTCFAMLPQICHLCGVHVIMVFYASFDGMKKKRNQSVLFRKRISFGWEARIPNSSASGEIPRTDTC